MADIVLLIPEDAEIVDELERAFRITILDEEAQRCATVGDLFAVVARKVRMVDRGVHPCPAASAFRRLRAALRLEHPSRTATPATPLADLMPRTRRGAWWHRLGRSSCMDMPQILPLAPAGWLTRILGPDRPGDRHREAIGLGAGATLGDLARIIAALNPGLLAGPSATMRTKDAWTALEGVIRHFTGFSGPIEKRTRFRIV